MMHEGRPADNFFYTVFLQDGATKFTDSLNKATDCSGNLSSLSKIKQCLWHGEGKIYLTNGRIFIGNFNTHKMSDGKMYEMQADNSYTLF